MKNLQYKYSDSKYKGFKNDPEMKKTKIAQHYVTYSIALNALLDKGCVSSSIIAVLHHL